MRISIVSYSTKDTKKAQNPQRFKNSVQLCAKLWALCGKKVYGQKALRQKAQNPQRFKTTVPLCVKL
jgi:hypothetical protein